MEITINNKKFTKDELLRLIEKSKIGAIKHINDSSNIGLRSAKKIVDNLTRNPNYYDNAVLKNKKKSFVAEKTTTPNSKNIIEKGLEEEKVGSHIIRYDNQNKKWIYILGLIFIVALLYFLKTK